ncbi:MAG: PCRF domain-containing protein, partial [Micrococcales bacterium]|nr:PCRF domain-containing protein [Micrococcales bacterium]
LLTWVLSAAIVVVVLYTPTYLQKVHHVPAALAPGLVFPATALADTVQGNGRALITKDTATVRNLAEAEARRDVVRAMLAATLGAERVREAGPDVIERMAGQLRPDMFSGQTSERIGNEFLIHLTAEIDQSWFRTMLENFGLDSPSQRADGDRQLILVYLDREDGTATDLSAPAEVEVEYDRRTGGSFSDRSAVTASSKEAAGSSYRNAAASSSAASGAYKEREGASYGVSGRRGSAAGASSAASAGAYSGRSASASTTRASSAYAASSSFSDRTNVQAEVHDDVRYRAHIVYQQPPKSADGDAIRNGLAGELLKYDVQLADSWQALSAYYPAGVPRYADLKGWKIELMSSSPSDAGGYKEITALIKGEQKLTDLGGVVAAAAHELGTPLATIKLVSSELADELEDSPELRDDALLIREQADRCRDILHSMGRVGKDDLHMRSAPLLAVLREAAEPHLE